MKIDDIIEQFAPLECRIVPCKGHNPYRMSWEGWTGKDYQFCLKKGNRTLSGYYCGGHALQAEPGPADILQYIATECGRAARCTVVADWVNAAQADHPGCAIDVEIAKFELRYARGLLDRTKMLLGDDGAALLLTCANVPTNTPSLAIKPVKTAADQTPVKAHRIVVPKPAPAAASPVIHEHGRPWPKAADAYTENIGQAAKPVVVPAPVPVVPATPAAPLPTEDMWP